MININLNKYCIKWLMYCEGLLKKKFDPLDYYSTVRLDTVVHLQLNCNCITLQK